MLKVGARMRALAEGQTAVEVEEAGKFSLGQFQKC
jgi:hypothetical protein